MPKFNVYWDEIITYVVEVEAESVDDAYEQFTDPDARLTEPDVVTSDFADNFQVEEI